MPENLKPKLPAGQTVKWKEQEYPSIYTNLMGLAMTPFDIAVMFGEVGDATPEEVTGIPRVKVLLAPEQANNLMKLLGVALKAYADNNGQLRTSGAVNVESLAAHMSENEVNTKQ